MMSQIYISTSCLGHKLALKDILDLYANQGFKKVELSHVQGVVNLNILKNYKFQYVIHNYFPPAISPFILNIASSHIIELENSLNFVKNALEVCNKYDITQYSLHGGFRSTGIATEHGIIFDSQTVPYAKAFNTLIESLNMIDKWATEYGISVLIENNVCSTETAGFVGGKVLLQSPSEFYTLFEKLGSNRIGILLDLGHLKVASNFLDVELETAIQMLKCHVGMLHLHDNNGKCDQHKSISRNSPLLYLIKKHFDNKIPIALEPICSSIQEVCMNLLNVESYLKSS